MIGPHVQKAIHDALTGAAICSGRVYDRVPEKPTYPYVTLGDEQVLDASNSCGDGWDIIADVHVWSRPDATSKAEVKTVASAVVNAVMAMTTIAGFSLAQVNFETMQTRRETDGLTEHSICVFRVLVDAAT